MILIFGFAFTYCCWIFCVCDLLLGFVGMIINLWAWACVYMLTLKMFVGLLVFVLGFIGWFVLTFGFSLGFDLSVWEVVLAVFSVCFGNDLLFFVFLFICVMEFVCCLCLCLFWGLLLIALFVWIVVAIWF